MLEVNTITSRNEYDLTLYVASHTPTPVLYYFLCFVSLVRSTLVPYGVRPLYGT